MKFRIVYSRPHFTTPYELESWRWWWPFWQFAGLFGSIEEAEVSATKQLNRVIKVLP